MRALLVLGLLLASLAVVPSAGAKQFVRLEVVGDRALAVTLRGQEFSPASMLSSPADVTPSGPYLLLYPIFGGPFVGEPGRYFPEQGVACFSFDRSVLGECGRVNAAAAAAQLTAADLPRLTRSPTILSRLRIFGREGRVDSNGAVAVELAFNRWPLARPAAKPADCTPVRGVWRGPAAASRPTRFCLSIRGVWAGGKLYRTRLLRTLGGI